MVIQGNYNSIFTCYLKVVLDRFFLNLEFVLDDSISHYLDENLSWKEHLKLTENKIAKNTGLIYKAKPYLIKDSLLALYFSYIRSYINYAIVVWGSRHRTYLRKISSQQKRA